MILAGVIVLQQDFRLCVAIEQMKPRGLHLEPMGATLFIYDMLGVHRVRGFTVVRNTAAVPAAAHQPGNLVQRRARHGVMLAEIWLADGKAAPHLRASAKCLEWERSLVGIPFPGIEVRIVDGDRNETWAARRAGRGDLVRAAPGSWATLTPAAH